MFALAALACGVSAASVRAVADEPPLPPPRPPELGAPGKAPAEPPPSAAKTEAASSCLGKLIADGAGAEGRRRPGVGRGMRD